MCGLSTVVTPAGASLTMYREIRSYANSIWDDNNNNHQYAAKHTQNDQPMKRFEYNSNHTTSPARATPSNFVDSLPTIMVSWVINSYLHRYSFRWEGSLISTRKSILQLLNNLFSCREKKHIMEGDSKIKQENATNNTTTPR